MRNALVSVGCMAGPNYQRPSVETPASWRFEEKEAGEVANTPWWKQFGDPVLNELLHVALKENKDLKTAAALELRRSPDCPDLHRRRHPRTGELG